MVPINLLLNILAGAISIVGVAPLYGNLDVVVRLVFPAAVLGAVLQETRRIRPLRGVELSVPAMVLVGMYMLQFSRDNLLEPAANTIVALLAVRLLGERLPRTYLQLYALALFSLAASSLFNLSALFLVYLLVLVLAIAVSLVLLTFFSEDRRLCLSRRGVRRVATAAVAMPVFSLPLMVLFFIVMPRPQFPLLDFLAPSEEGRTGLSERLEPGSVGRVNPVQSAVMRVESEPLAKDDLYWRGIVLNRPRGQAWVRDTVQEQSVVASGKGRVVRQTVYCEPASGAYLPILDAPQRLTGIRAGQEPDLVYRRRQNSSRVRYGSISVLNGTIQVHGGIDRSFYLQVPEQISPRIIQLARTISQRGRSDQERLALVEEHFRRGGYRYSTRNLPQTADPLGSFLFEDKAGHCEFFATSFLVLLRSAGVPARLVGGYYGGEYNELGGYYLVTEAMAHVWVEVYLDGVGWVRRDPSGYAVGFVSSQGASAHPLRLFADSLNYFWNRSIIAYDLDKQVSVYHQATGAVRRFSLSPLLAWVLGGIVLVGGICWSFGRWGWPWGRMSREARLARAFRGRAARCCPAGSITPAMGLLELAEQVDTPQARQFAQIYCQAIYRDRPLTTQECRQLRLLLKGF